MCLAIPGELMELAEKDGLRFGKVRFGGISRDVCLEYQPEAKVGDFVLVHVGFAISTLNAEEAARSLEILQQIGQTAEFEAEEAAQAGREANLAREFAGLTEAVEADLLVREAQRAEVPTALAAAVEAELLVREAQRAGAATEEEPATQARATGTDGGLR